MEKRLQAERISEFVRSSHYYGIVPIYPFNKCTNHFYDFLREHSLPRQCQYLFFERISNTDVRKLVQVVLFFVVRPGTTRCDEYYYEELIIDGNLGVRITSNAPCWQDKQTLFDSFAEAIQQVLENHHAATSSPRRKNTFHHSWVTVCRPLPKPRGHKNTGIGLVAQRVWKLKNLCALVIKSELMRRDNIKYFKMPLINSRMRNYALDFNAFLYDV
jgi:hypothetical protein